MCLSRYNENLLVWQKFPPIYIKMNNIDIKRKRINYVAGIAELRIILGIFTSPEGSQAPEFAWHCPETSGAEEFEAVLPIPSEISSYPVTDLPLHY